MTEKVFGTQKKGSIRDIPLPTEARSANTLDLQNKSDDNFDNWSNMKRKNKRFGSKLIGFLLITIMGLALYSFLFHSGSIVVKQMVTKVTVTGNDYTASLDPSQGVEFVRVNPFTKTVSQYVEGSQEENKQTKTTGTITVFNTDSDSKNYIKNTRFETEDGRVYRAFKRFVIPKGTTANPGSVEVLVVAENPGEKYNSEGGAEFTLPALKEQNNPDFEKVYAKQTQPLEGGFSGVIRVPTADDIAEAKTKLRTQIEQDLEKDFAASLPDNYIVNKDYISVSEVTFIEKPNSEKGGLDIEASANLDSVVFKKEVFEQFLAKELLDGYQSSDNVAIDNIGAITMTLEDEDLDPKTVETFKFKVEGDIVFRSDVNQDEIVNTASGKLKSHIENGLVNGLESVDIVEVSVSPFWRRSLPDNIERITVTVVE